MPAGRIIVPGWMPAVDSDGIPIPNASLFVYLNRTTTLAVVYEDEALTTPLANPVEADSSGQFPAIWQDEDSQFTVSVDAPFGPPGQPFTFNDISPASNNEFATGKANIDGDNIVAQETFRDNIGLADEPLQNIALAAIEISPEDFYLPADAGDWSPAFDRMETFRQALPSTGTRRIEVRLRKNEYLVTQPIVMEVGTSNSLYMFGCGHLFDGSRITTDETWTGGSSPVLTVQGDSGAGTTGQFILNNFAIVQDGEMTPTLPATSALLIQNINAPAGGSPIADVYIQGYKYGITTTNARLVDWSRCQVWARSITDAECIRVSATGVGAFGGDMTFNDCQTVAGVPEIYTSPNNSAGISLSAANGGEVRGIRFNGYIGYHADTPVKIRATANGTAGGTVGDIWFNPGCQFDQTVVRPWDIQTAQSGSNYGTIFSIWFLGCYWSTVLGSHDTALVSGSRLNAPNQINVNSGLVSELHIVNCMIPNFSKNLFFEKVVGLHFINNDLYGYGNPSVALDSIVIYSNCYNVKDRGNVARATTNNIDYAVIVSNGSNVEVGGWAGSVTAVRDFGSIVRFEAWGTPILRGPINVYVDRAAALAGGLTAGDVYETPAGALMRV